MAVASYSSSKSYRRTTSLRSESSLNLNMLVMTGGRERTEAEFRALYDAAGFRLTRVVHTASPMSIVEGEPL